MMTCSPHLRIGDSKALGVGQDLLHAVGVMALQEGQHRGRLKLAQQAHIELSHTRLRVDLESYRTLSFLSDLILHLNSSVSALVHPRV